MGKPTPDQPGTPSKSAEYHRAWRARNPDKIKRYPLSQESRERKKDYNKGYYAKWIEEHREAYNAKQRRMRAEKRIIRLRKQLEEAEAALK